MIRKWANTAFATLILLCSMLSGTDIHATEDKPDLQDLVKQVDSLNLLAGKLKFEDIGLSLAAATEARTLAKSCNYMEGEALALLNMSSVQILQEKYPLALENFFKCLDLYRSLSNVDQQINVLQSIAGLFLSLKDPVRAETYLDQAEDLLARSNNPGNLGIARLARGHLEMVKGNYEKSIDYFYRSAYFCLKYNDDLGVARAYKWIGDVLIRMKQLNRAIFTYQKAISIHKKYDDLKEVSILNTRIAHAYSVLGKKDLALLYNRKAYRERLVSGVKTLTTSSIINVGGSYMEVGKVDSAIYYLKTGLRKSIGEKRTYLTEEAHLLLAQCYTQKKDFKLSLQHYQQYFQLHEQLLEDRNKSTIKEFETEHLVRDVENRHNLLAKENETQYLVLRNNRLQLTFIIIILILIIGVGLMVHILTRRTQRSEKELQVLNFKLENEIREHKEAEKKLQESENLYRFIAMHLPDVISRFDRDLKRTFVSPSCVTMYGYTEEELLTRPDPLEVVDLSYRKQVRSSMESIFQKKSPQTLVYRVRKKDGSAFWVESRINPMLDPVSGEAHEMITVVRDISDRLKYEEQLAENERQKEVLLYEIHHRVKNNFAILISLMDLQKQFAREDTLDMPLIDLQLRVRTMSLVHEQLYHNHSIDAIPLGSYLDRLAAVIGSAFSKPNIRVHTNVQECAARIEIALPLGLIVNELLTNCYKYAFPENQEGDLWINLHIDKTRNDTGNGLQSLYYILNVKDNGVGLPENFSFENNTSTGSRIIHILIEQLEAQYEISRQPGASFTLRFAAFPKDYN